MGPHSQVDDANVPRRVLEAQLRESFARVVYSHKTHEKCADIYSTEVEVIKWSQIILTAMTTGGFAAVIFGWWSEAPFLGAILALILLCLNSYTKDHDLGDLAQKHRQAANEIWFVRENYRSLLTDLSIGKPLDAIQQDRDALLKQLKSVYAGVPSTTSRAYRRAQKALKQDEEMKFSDAEIDAFLPKELRRS